MKYLHKCQCCGKNKDSLIGVFTGADGHCAACIDCVRQADSLRGLQFPERELLFGMADGMTIGEVSEATALDVL